MSATGCGESELAESAPRISPRRARIDGPHQAGPEHPADGHEAGEPIPAPAVGEGELLEVVEEATEAMVAAVAGQTLDARREQLDLQAAQLADHLRERLREVDRREARLNARAAAVESELRASRVWLRERAAEFYERDANREQQLSQLEDELRARQLEIERREALLRAAEATVAQHAAQLDRDQAALAADRHAWHQQKARQQQAIQEQQAAAEAELADRTLRLEARQDWIERQKAALEQVRREALAAHRQALEMRLLAEQLWAQVGGRTTPAEVTQAIAQLRLKLAEQYRLEEQSVAAAKEELVQLGERISEQHRELVQLRSGLKEWAAARQAEIEQQAAALVQRELALDAQQDEFRQAQQTWQTDRRRYEQQIRDLSAQLRTLPAAA